MELREAVVARTAFLGFALDDEANGKVDADSSVVVDIGKSHDGHRVLVCRTDEQVREVAFWVRVRV